MNQDFSAANSVSHPGHSFWRDYSAALKSGTYEYFDNAPTFMVTLRTHEKEKKFYLNLCNGDVVRIETDLHAEPLSSMTSLPKGSDGYDQALAEMKEMLTTMLSMNERNLVPR